MPSLQRASALIRGEHRVCRHYKALVITFQNQNNIATFSARKGGWLGCPFCSMPRERADNSERKKYAGYVVLLMGCGATTYYTFPYPAGGGERGEGAVEEGEQQSIAVSNWSVTNEVEVQHGDYLQSESLEELERMVREADSKRKKMRPVGSGLLPNDIGLNAQGMVNLALMDKVLHVDVHNNTVCLQPGVTVSNLVDYYAPTTLPCKNLLP